MSTEQAPRRAREVNRVNRVPSAAPMKQARALTEDVLLLARSIVFRLRARPDVVLFGDITRVERETVTLVLWGWLRRRVELHFEEVLSASPSSVAKFSEQRKIADAQRALEGDASWPPR
jgi:hypothetical protein